MGNTKEFSLVPDLPVPDTGAVLARERASATFNTKDLTLHLYGERLLETKDRVLETVKSEPLLDKRGKYTLGRQDAFKAALASSKRMTQLAKEYGWSIEE